MANNGKVGEPTGDPDMHTYCIGYGSYEDSCKLYFSSEEKLTRAQLMDKLVAAANELLEKRPDVQGLIDNYALSPANIGRLFGCTTKIWQISDLFPNIGAFLQVQGLKWILPEEEISLFGWADLRDEDGWKNEVYGETEEFLKRVKTELADSREEFMEEWHERIKREKEEDA